MRLTINNLLNKHSNKIAFVIGNGPSARPVIEKLMKTRAAKELSHNDEIVICCNDIDTHLKNIGKSLLDLKPNYWTLANPAMTVENSYSRLNEMKEYGGCLLNGDSVLYGSSRDIVDISEKVLEIDFLGYDQRHFEGKTCQHVAPCCIKNMENIKQGRLTIQEVLQKYSGHTSRYGTGSTVAVHMLAFAIIMGCKKIYIAGVDLDYSLGYFDNITRNGDTFMGCEDIPADFSIIKKSADNIGCLIYNLSDVSMLKSIFDTNRLESIQ